MNGKELEESKEERGPGSPGNRQVERERAVCKRGQDRKCYTGPDFQVIPFQRQRHLHWAVPVQAICEAAPGICGSSLVTLTGKGQGGARRGAKKGSQVRLWCASPRLSGAPEGAGLDLTGGEEAAGRHGTDEQCNVSEKGCSLLHQMEKEVPGRTLAD